MNRAKGGLLVWVAVILGLGPWAPGALAFCPPCQPVTAWIDGTAPHQTVRYKVYDARKGAYMEDSWTETDSQPTEIGSLQFSQGMVTWVALVNRSEYRVYCRVYDPGRSSWQGDQWLDDSAGYHTVAYHRMADGVVSWIAGAGPGATKVVLRTYDPGPGVWKSGELVSTYTGFHTVFNRDGVVAWDLINISPPYNCDLQFAVYDPSRGDWRTSEAIIPLAQGQQYPSININAATVFYSNPDFSYHFGYDATSGTWSQDLNTPPFCRFVAQPTGGKAPLWVWLTDMSIGAYSWPRSWTFGDGSGPSTAISPSHTYGSTGKFTVTQQYNGQSWFSREITVTATGPTSTPAMDLLLLE